MNNEVIGVFILETEGYVEISYCEFLNRCSTDETYRSKHFIYVSKRLLEVSHDDYMKHYQELEHNKYLKKLDIANGLISMEDMDNPEIACVFNFDEVAEIVESEMQRKKISECLSMLTEDERELIEALFYYGLTEREYAAQKKVYHNAIHKKKMRILKKLKKLLKN